MIRESNHPACLCGCGELADECAGPNPSPLGSMRVADSLLPYFGPEDDEAEW